ncbi:hypothetical protein SteCoe_9252 [Stentor coeruleus]|uniref:Uncharacterized protein n=1 Tax=Stentor coeruleus TaxID=5963 RepID=A0A1R2CI89_9CILI|nr:hypothetical protein SteCoe_9252 [Stentor coeruleus]
MQDKDRELDAILQEARESYQKRIEDLKTSLKAISSGPQNKDMFNNLDRFSPLKTTLNNQDSQKYTVSFRPNPTPTSHEESKNPRLRPSNSEDSGFHNKILTSKLEEENLNNNQLQDEIRNMSQHIISLEENLERWKKSCKEAEDNNIDLRSRLKDTTMQINKLTSEISRLREFKNEPNDRELQSLKMHYKEKINRLKEKMLIQASERQSFLNEIDILRQREKEFKRVCETQISEICEEYTSNLKSLKFGHSEAIIKLKSEYEFMAESENTKLLEEINSLHLALHENETSFRLNQEKLQDYENHLRKAQDKMQEYDFIILNNKEKLEKILQAKESLELSLKEKDSLINDLHLSLQKQRSDYELRLKQNIDESKSSNYQQNKIIEDLQKQNTTQVKVQIELEVQLESERIKILNLESKSSRIEAAYSELMHNHQNALHKCQILENQISQQSSEFQKKKDFELTKYNDRIRSLENELKSFYSVNGAQAKELDVLKQLVAEIEVKQSEDIKALQMKHDENIREIKKLDRYEYLQLSDALETTKEHLDECETQLKEYQNKDLEYGKLIKSLENALRDNAELKNILGKIQKSVGISKSIKENIRFQVLKIRENVEYLEKNTKEELNDYKNYQYKCLGAFAKAIMQHMDGIARNQGSYAQQFSSERNKIAEELYKAYNKVGYLENSLQNAHSNMRKIEEENAILKQNPEGRDVERVKNYYNGFLGQILSQVSFLEGSIEESFDFLALKVQEVKNFAQEDAESLEKINRDIVEQAKKSIEYYRDKLLKLENDKNVENSRSQQELFSLEQRLAQVLDDIREQRS